MTTEKIIVYFHLVHFLLLWVTVYDIMTVDLHEKPWEPLSWRPFELKGRRYLLPFSHTNILASSIVSLSGLDLHCLTKPFASDQLVPSSNKSWPLIWSCLQPHKHELSARGYWSLACARPGRLILGCWMEQRQIQISDWALTRAIHCLPVTYGMTSSSTYYYTKAMTDLFVNAAGESGVKFQSISTVTDFWTVSFPRAFNILNIHHADTRELCQYLTVHC